MASGSAGSLGSGGMLTKIQAAKLAARSGANTIIANGRTIDVLRRLREGETLGTLFVPDQEPLLARKQWLAGHLKAKGELHLDAGAARVLTQQGKSLLSVGVSLVKGNFTRGDMVLIFDSRGQTIARGLVNYSSSEAFKIVGLASGSIESTLGYVAEPELIHRDNLVLL